MAEVSILDQRRIEAKFAGQLLRTLAEEVGEERARAILRKAITAMAHAAGREMAAQKPGNEDGRNPPDLEDYAAILPLWQKDDGIAIQWLERTPEKLAFNVTRCRYAETYRELGLGDLGDTLSCNRDGEFCHGYNPDIELQRTQTLMGGAKFCDFRYTLKKKGG
ncbi:MAG TPA: L-2-amino-thiazoline-4-carboxylic acid hydrolase [Albitalea sp.]